MDYEIGSRVGDYEILEILGSGGMGRVYKVRNMIYDRIEAMKVLRPDIMADPEFADRFMREIKVQGSLSHPNITALYTALRIENQVVMLMEHVQGITLHKMTEFGRVPIHKAIDYTLQVLSALSYAHDRRVIHRDLKPANIMVANDGQVKLMDFGIAKLVADRTLTRTGSAIGSLYYMSPEQIRGARDLDARADLYSIGITLYEIVTGVRPFEGDSEYSIMEAHLRKQPTPPIEICSEMPPRLSAIILRALEKEPNMRFQSADEFRAALSNMIASPSPTETVVSSGVLSEETLRSSAASLPERVEMPASRWNASRRQRGLWIAAGALLTLVVIVLIAVQLRNRLGVTGNAPAIQQTRVEDSKQSTGIGVSNPAPPSRTPDKKIEKPIVPVAENPKPAPAIQAEPQKKAASNQPADSSENAATISQPSAAQNQLAEQMKSLRARFEDLRNRADTIKASLANLRRQRGDVKLGMRPEIALVARRMEFHLNSAKEGLESGNPRSVKINLDSAEREIIRLTKLANLRKPVN